MDVDHREGRGGGAARPPEFGVRGTLMQIVPQILSFFKISSTRLLALQCSIQEALQMQRERAMRHKYKILHLKRLAI